MQNILASNTFDMNELSEIISYMVNTGNLNIFTIKKLSEIKCVEYTSNTHLSDKVFNKIKASLRRVRHGGLENFNKAIDALDAVSAGIDITQNSWQIFRLFVLQKALDMDEARSRINLLEDLNIKDKAYWQALGEIKDQLLRYNGAFWDKLVNAYRLNSNAFRDAGRSVLKLTIALQQIFSGLSLNPWLKSLLFTADQAIMVKDHWDHLKIATIAATLYNSLKEHDHSDSQISCILYSEYLFTHHYNAAFDNSYIDFLAFISSRYNLFVQYLKKNEDHLKSLILQYYLGLSGAQNHQVQQEKEITDTDLTPKLLSKKLNKDNIQYEWLCDVNGDQKIDKVTLYFTKQANLMLVTKLADAPFAMAQTLDLSDHFDIKEFRYPRFSKERIAFSDSDSDRFGSIDVDFVFDFFVSAYNNKRAILVVRTLFGGSGLGATDPGEECFLFIPYDNHINKYRLGEYYGVCGKGNEIKQTTEKDGIVRTLQVLNWYSFLAHAEVPAIIRAFMWDWRRMQIKEISTDVYRAEYMQLLAKLKEYLAYAQQNHLSNDITKIKEDIGKINKLLKGN